MTKKTSTWTGMIPTEDTALAVTDSGGSGPVVVYLNGSYASQKHWSPTIGHLGDDLRHITFDERARGKSEKSSDYSFAACLRDIDAVMDARQVGRAILVGWSYGAALAVHWADQHPLRVAGVVSVDGAYPYDSLGTGDLKREDIRRLFHRLRFLFPAARKMGLAARMSADQHALINIEINELLSRIGPVLERLEVPTKFIVADGAHLGGDEVLMRRVRDSLRPVLEKNRNITVGASVPYNHSKVISRGAAEISEMIRELATVEKERAS